MKSKNDARLELKIPTERRDALTALAEQTGVSSSDLVRLAIGRLLRDGEIAALTGGRWSRLRGQSIDARWAEREQPEPEAA